MLTYKELIQIVGQRKTTQIFKMGGRCEQTAHKRNISYQHKYEKIINLINSQRYAN